MAEKKTGLAPLPAGLLSPSAPPEPEADPEVDPEADAPPPGADSAEPPRGAGPPGAGARAPRSRRRRDPAVAARGRKLYLPDAIHDRLRLLAFSRKERISVVAADLLDKALPHWRVERQ